MADLRFEWDGSKASANLAKHGVSFDEACSVFEDEHALLASDDAHSAREDRFVLLGLTGRARLLVVVHCVRESESVLRIISARKATRREQDQYIEARG